MNFHSTVQQSSGRRNGTPEVLLSTLLSLVLLLGLAPPGAGQATAAGSDTPRFGDPDNRFVNYKLSYVQGDRATALLRVLGYSVIEFQAQPNAGTLVYDQIFTTLSEADALELPVVIRLIDSDKTSLLEPEPMTGPLPLSAEPALGDAANLRLGGQFLDRITDGAPQQRLLIVYDGDDPGSLQKLLNLLRDEIDIPARQLLIEALVIELDQDKLRDVGVDFAGRKDGSTFSFLTGAAGFAQPFTYTFERPSVKTLFELNVSLKALVSRGHAKVLSRPSVLVLDGRQARIQVGQKIPYSSSISATNTGTLSSTDYLTTGIVLNLRPRVSEDGSQITMQVETLISSAGPSGFDPRTGVLVPPRIQSREVQTLVRVSDNTPFIIGGLISTTEETGVSGVPGLSRIPGLGALFRKKTKNDAKREVIVVITPHVVPQEDRTFTYGIPADSEIFDSFDTEMFRNVYRIRSSDVFDLAFVYESRGLHEVIARARRRAEAEPSLRKEEPIAALLEGGVPGEEVLVRRMLWEVVRKRGFGRHVDPSKIFFYHRTEDGEGLHVEALEPYCERGMNSLALIFERAGTVTLERPFDPPRATPRCENVSAKGYLKRLRAGNVLGDDGTWQRSAVVLNEDYTDASGPGTLDMLLDVLALKQLLRLNPQLSLTLEGFQTGVEVVFPSQSGLRDRFHLVDRQAAELFYQVADYYYAFEQEFTRETRDIRRRLNGKA